LDLFARLGRVLGQSRPHLVHLSREFFGGEEALLKEDVGEGDDPTLLIAELAYHLGAQAFDAALRPRYSLHGFCRGSTASWLQVGQMRGTRTVGAGGSSDRCPAARAFSKRLSREALRQVVDQGADRRWETAARREHEMHQALMPSPGRQDADQLAIVQRPAADMVGQQGDAQPSNGGVTHGREVATAQAGLML
jgi:hypothetical protein